MMVRKAKEKVTTTTKGGKIWYGGEEVEKMVEEELLVRGLEKAMPSLVVKVMMEQVESLLKRKEKNREAIIDFLKAQGVMDIMGSTVDVENKVITHLDLVDAAENRLKKVSRMSSGGGIGDLLSRLLAE